MRGWLAAAIALAALIGVTVPAEDGARVRTPAPPNKILPLGPVKATQPAALVRRHRANLGNALVGWVRHEGKWFIWYAPDRGWHDVQSFGGIDLASGDGEQAVSFGFSGWPSPLTFEDVVRYWLHAMGTSGVVVDVAFDSTGPTTRQGAIYRRVYTWHAFRTDLRQNIRGVLTIHVYREDATGTYGFDDYTRAGPAAGYSRIDPSLLQIQNAIIYKPKEPPCLRHDPKCEAKKRK